jgi:ABC-type multidrug transport system fused ATPase/permease subunit
VFDNAPKGRDFSSGKDFVLKKADIELKNINFSYGKNTVFNNFNLNIKG